MAGRRRGRPRKYDGIHSGVLDDAALLALIWEAGGNVSKAASELNHEGTKSLYSALARLQDYANENVSKNDPDYNFLFRFDKESRKALWTQKGVSLVRKGQEVLEIRATFAEEREKGLRLNQHRTKCKTPLYEHSEILLAQPDKESNFEIFHMCRKCGLYMRDINTVEFMKWQNEHPELYSGLNASFGKVSDEGL